MAAHSTDNDGEPFFYFQPSDIVNQILNFDLPTPIDVQVCGAKQGKNYVIAQKIAAEIRHVPGAVDVHVQQVPANTLIFRSEGTQVGIVDANNKVKLLKVKVERDFGAKPEISGLTENDSVILNPSDSLRDGESVQVVQKATD
jgi:hypothetical protein